MNTLSDQGALIINSISEINSTSTRQETDSCHPSPLDSNGRIGQSSGGCSTAACFTAGAGTAHQARGDHRSQEKQGYL